MGVFSPSERESFERGVKALESIADSLMKLANPEFVITNLPEGSFEMGYGSQWQHWKTVKVDLSKAALLRQGDRFEGGTIYSITVRKNHADVRVFS